MVAFALRADGWYLRSAIVWHKPNPMPESVRDRPTSSYEHVFLFSKREKYFYDADAIAEPSEDSSLARLSQDVASQAGSNRANGGVKTNGPMKAVGGATRNARNVWTITTQPFSGAHFATMPPELAERCIKASSKPGDTILDPFGGAGTTGLVADRLARNAILCELNPEYVKIARERIINDAPLFCQIKNIKSG
jgi:DNA modification methylase